MADEPTRPLLQSLMIRFAILILLSGALPWAYPRTEQAVLGRVTDAVRYVDGQPIVELVLDLQQLMESENPNPWAWAETSEPFRTWARPIIEVPDQQLPSLARFVADVSGLNLTQATTMLRHRIHVAWFGEILLERRSGKVLPIPDVFVSIEFDDRVEDLKRLLEALRNEPLIWGLGTSVHKPVGGEWALHYTSDNSDGIQAWYAVRKNVIMLATDRLRLHRTLLGLRGGFPQQEISQHHQSFVLLEWDLERDLDLTGPELQSMAKLSRELNRKGIRSLVWSADLENQGCCVDQLAVRMAPSFDPPQSPSVPTVVDPTHLVLHWNLQEVWDVLRTIMVQPQTMVQRMGMAALRSMIGRCGTRLEVQLAEGSDPDNPCVRLSFPEAKEDPILGMMSGLARLVGADLEAIDQGYVLGGDTVAHMGTALTVKRLPGGGLELRSGPDLPRTTGTDGVPRRGSFLSGVFSKRFALPFAKTWVTAMGPAERPELGEWPRRALEDALGQVSLEATYRDLQFRGTVRSRLGLMPLVIWGTLPENWE